MKLLQCFNIFDNKSLLIAMETNTPNDIMCEIQDKKDILKHIYIIPNLKIYSRLCCNIDKNIHAINDVVYKYKDSFLYIYNNTVHPNNPRYKYQAPEVFYEWYEDHRYQYDSMDEFKEILYNTITIMSNIINNIEYETPKRSLCVQSFIQDDEQYASILANFHKGISLEQYFKLEREKQDANIIK